MILQQTAAVADLVRLTADERAAWSAFAAHCYRHGENVLGTKASAGAAVGRVRYETYATVSGAMLPVMAQRVGSPDFLTAAQESAIIAEIEACYVEALRADAGAVRLTRAEYVVTAEDSDWIAQSGDADAGVWGTLTSGQRDAMVRVWRGVKAAEALDAQVRR